MYLAPKAGSFCAEKSAFLRQKSAPFISSDTKNVRGIEPCMRNVNKTITPIHTQGKRVSPCFQELWRIVPERI